MAALDRQALRSSESPELTLARRIQRSGPREGWLVFLLALTAVLTLPISASSNGLIVGLEPAVGLSILGLVAGWWLGHSRRSGIASAFLLLGAGIVADLIWGAHVLAVLPFFGQAIAWLSWWASPLVGAVHEPPLREPPLPEGQNWLEALFSARSEPGPPVTYFAEQWGSLTGFAQRVGWWTGGLASGQGGISDNLVLVALACLIVWCVAAWAGWWIARYGKAFVALAPTGILLAQQVYAANESHVALLTFLGASTFLLVMANLNRQARQWEESGADYSPEIRLDAFMVAGVLAGVCVLLSPTIPFVTSGELSRKFWQLFEDPYRNIEDRWGSSFRGAQAGRSLVPPEGVAEGGLPRSHLLGGSPELGKEIAMRVHTRGASAGEQLYWRGQTFAFYDGHGWSEPEGSVSEVGLAAGQPWSIGQRLVERRTVLSRVEIAAASRAVLYGAGEPISVDRPYLALLRKPGDLVALRARGGPRRYNVLGGVIDQDPDLLRATGTDYPGDVAFAETYLQLPADMPPELLRYAEQVTAGAETPYDRALAIEAALREVPYTLDVPPPPRDRELVSWFLFDLQEGYCDYYASAMVILARLSGIPARLAVGYSTGDYERENEQYVVTELAAHSWPELYFPGVGWAPFEPTAGRSAPERIATGGGIPPWMLGPNSMRLDAGLSALRDASEAERRLGTVTGSVRWSLFALNALVAALVLWPWLRRRPSGPPDSLPGLFERLTTYGGRLGSQAREADTPREYAEQVSDAAIKAAEVARFRKGRAEEDAALVQREATQLALAFEKATYAPETTELLVAAYAESRDWTPLFRALRRLWVGRLGRK